VCKIVIAITFIKFKPIIGLILRLYYTTSPGSCTLHIYNKFTADLKFNCKYKATVYSAKESSKVYYRPKTDSCQESFVNLKILTPCKRYGKKLSLCLTKHQTMKAYLFLN